MPGLISIAFTETELHMLSAQMSGTLEGLHGNVHLGPLTDAALVTGTLKLLRAESGPAATQNRPLHLPAWAMRAIIAAVVPSGVEFPKPAPAKVRKPKRRPSPRRARKPRPQTELEVDTALAGLGDRLVHDDPRAGLDQ